MELAKLIFVTATYRRPLRLRYFQRNIAVISQVPQVLWIIIEDASVTDPDLAHALAQSGIEHVYLAHGPTCHYGVAQKFHGFDYIKEKKLAGIVAILDDDNYYRPGYFEQIRKTKRVSISSVSNIGPTGREGPIVSAGKITGWLAYANSRKYPVNWAAVAFHSSVLQNMESPFFSDEISQEETTFLERFVRSPDELEILSDVETPGLAYYNLSLWYSPNTWAIKQIFKRILPSSIFGAIKVMCGSSSRPK